MVGTVTSVPSTPAAFIGHGSPMNALDRNRYTDAWRAFGASVTRPRGVLAVSAHWYVPVTAVTSMAEPRTIHDFGGFPDDLFAVQYPAPGSPDLAAEVIALLDPVPVVADDHQWGLDHGTWSVLAHVFPDADVPVVQLSIDASRGIEHHLALGRALAPLRESGVLVLGSGNVVHNLGRIDWGAEDRGDDWALRFDEAAREIMTTRPGDLAELVDHPDFRAAAPTPEHLWPLAYIAGVADAAGAVAVPFVEGPTLGSLTMTSYLVPT